METSGKMGDLIGRVLSGARAEAEAAVERARAVASRETESARLEAGARRRAAEASVAAEAEAGRQAALARLALGERRAVMERQERAVETVLDSAIERLRRIGDPAARLGLLARLVEEAVRELGARSARVTLNDAERRLAIAAGFPAAVAGAAVAIGEAAAGGTAGGPVVTDESGRVRFDNTFEARLERFRPTLRARIAQRLWRGDGKT
jgi:V/A-type H+-transporting ATPase subunit E